MIVATHKDSRTPGIRSTNWRDTKSKEYTFRDTRPLKIFHTTISFSKLDTNIWIIYCSSLNLSPVRELVERRNAL